MQENQQHTQLIDPTVARIYNLKKNMHNLITALSSVLEQLLEFVLRRDQVKKSIAHRKRLLESNQARYAVYACAVFQVSLTEYFAKPDINAEYKHCL